MSSITYHPHPTAAAMNTITSFEDAHKAMIEIRKFTEAQMWRETLPSTPRRKIFTAEIVRPMRDAESLLEVCRAEEFANGSQYGSPAEATSIGD